SGLLVNMDWQHLIMNGENLAEYAALLAAEGKLGHQHANDGWGAFDDDNVVGTNFFIQTLELAVTLQDVGYGSNGEILGYDLYPYTEDQVQAVRRPVHPRGEVPDQLPLEHRAAHRLDLVLRVRIEVVAEERE